MALRKIRLQGGTKRCPYCGEEINVTATKCRYCGEWLAKNVTKPSDRKSVV